jgi:hypothetical protein
MTRCLDLDAEPANGETISPSDGVNTMPTSLPLFALPNIEIKRPIGVEGFALASIHDARVQELADAHPNFREFLSRFTTEFGQQLCQVFLSAARMLPLPTARSTP